MDAKPVSTPADLNVNSDEVMVGNLVYAAIVTQPDILP